MNVFIIVVGTYFFLKYEKVNANKINYLNINKHIKQHSYSTEILFVLNYQHKL